MIIFAIPLRARETTDDWDKCEKNFWDTIKSIFNQDGGSFRCIVACNTIPEKPENFQYDNRLEFITVNTPIPKEWVEMSRDKFYKLTVIAVRIREILEEQEYPEKGIYVMPVDADDLLNHRIAKWCADHPEEHGFVSKAGYVWQKGKPYFKKYRNMHTYCGSCNIIKMYIEDLPDKIYPAELALDRTLAAKFNREYPIRFDHGKVVEYYTNMGKSFGIIPFKTTVYVLGTGDNISTLYNKYYGPNDGKRFHPIAFLRKMNIFQYKYINGRIKKEFGVNFR